MPREFVGSRRVRPRRTDHRSRLHRRRDLGRRHLDRKPEPDLAAAGELDSDFDRYWNSEAVWPASLVLTPAPAGALDRLRAAAVDAQGRPGRPAEARRRRDCAYFFENVS